MAPQAVACTQQGPKRLEQASCHVWQASPNCNHCKSALLIATDAGAKSSLHVLCCTGCYASMLEKGIKALECTTRMQDSWSGLKCTFHQHSRVLASCRALGSHTCQCTAWPAHTLARYRGDPRPALGCMLEPRQAPAVLTWTVLGCSGLLHVHHCFAVQHSMLMGATCCHNNFAVGSLFNGAH